MRAELATADLSIGMRVRTAHDAPAGYGSRWAGLDGLIIGFPGTGNVRVRFDDGREVTCGPGDVTMIPGSDCAQPA